LHSGASRPILFAGTDLSLIFNETNIQFPYIDSAALHIEAILKNVLDEESLSRTWNLISSQLASVVGKQDGSDPMFMFSGWRCEPWAWKGIGW
jgi:hypothetical protein